MGAGMASYIEASSTSSLSMARWEDYDLYCHFVAGLVGEGVSRIFSECNMERSWLGEQLTLSNHMGLFLQKTNIIRDYAEDCADGRYFWPKECWNGPGADFATQADVAKGIVETSKGSRHYRPEGADGQKAMYVLSTMLLDALRHSTKALDYLSLIREQSIFNFCAIPQIMAIATINSMMGNADVFKRNVKIRKSQAVQLILKAVNPRDVSYVFLDYSAQMRQKLKPSDPNFLQWSIQLAKIEQWCETYYPSFVTAATENRQPDKRAAGMEKYSSERLQIAKSRALATGAIEPTPVGAGIDSRRARMTEEERAALDKKEQSEMIRFFTIMMIAMSLVMGLVAIAGFEIAWYVTQEGQDPFSLWVIKIYQGSKEVIYASIASNSATVKKATQAMRQKVDL
jgi:farnesyl-diphosphate farnesyltransferase